MNKEIHASQMKPGMYLVLKTFGNITKDEFLPVFEFVDANNGAINARYVAEYDDNAEAVFGTFPAEYLVSEEDYVLASDRLHRAKRDLDFLMSVK